LLRTPYRWIVVADDSLERDCEDILDGSLEGILDGSSNVPSTMPSQSPSKMPSQSPFKEPVATDEWVSYKTEMDNDDGCSDGAIVGCDSNRQVGPKSETEEDEIKKSAKRIVVRSTMCALVGKQGYRDYALCCESA
jgi:hypothetical protein